MKFQFTNNKPNQSESILLRQLISRTFRSIFFLVTAGKLPKNNGIPWRGNSGLKDGSDLTDVKGGLVGGYYDAGDNIKFHFPMAFSMTLLSWSVVEYSARYKAIGEYDHVRELIKWGTDYLLLTFNSSASTITKVYSQVSSRCRSASTIEKLHCRNIKNLR